MPRTSNRVAAIRKLPAEMRAHYSGRIARGNRAPWMQQCALDRVGADSARMTARGRPITINAEANPHVAYTRRHGRGRRNVGVAASLELLGVARVRDLIAAIRRL